MKAVFHDIYSKTLFGENAINISILTHLKRPKIVFGRGSAPDPSGGAHYALGTLPRPPSRLGYPLPTTPMASRLGASILGAFCTSAKVLFVESKKSLN